MSRRFKPKPSRVVDMSKPPERYWREGDPPPDPEPVKQAKRPREPKPPKVKKLRRVAKRLARSCPELAAVLLKIADDYVQRSQS